MVHPTLNAALGAGAALAMLCGSAQAAGLPDWSGVWFPHERNLFDPTALPPTQRQVKDTASSLFEASYERMYPPYRPDYEARYARKLKDTNEGRASDPTAGCVPPGFPRIMGTPYPLEFVVEKGRTTILFEAYSQVRRIYTDGSKHPDDLDLSYNGHSTGHWEGGTLVVDTVGLRGDTVFDVSCASHSDAMRVTERRRRTGPDTIEDRMVVEDPKALTKPWTVVRTYDRKPDWKIGEYVCEENQRNPILPDGSTGFLGPH